MRPERVVIWLRGSAAVLARRAAPSASRPYEDRPIVTVLEEQIRRREPLFRQVADITIDVDRRSPDEALAIALGNLPAETGSGEG